VDKIVLMDARSSSTREAGQLLEEALRGAFEAQGWRVQAAPSNECDLLVSGPAARVYAVELKIAREARFPQLEALLADALLRARRAASRLNAQPLAVVGAPALTDRSVEQLREYARNYLDGAAYGLIDAQGRLELHGPGLEGLRAVAERLPDLDRVRTPSPFDPFSDLNQWMLKVLLADRLPPQLLSAPREPVRNAHQLAILSKVSVPSASRFVAYMKREGWLAVDERRVELLRLEELMRRWSAFNAKPVQEIRAKWLLPAKDPVAQLDRGMAALHERGGADGSRACVALFAAAERLGYAHARGVMQHVYYDGDPGWVLEALGAVPALENEGADMALRRPAFRESTFRGMVVRDGVPVSDVLQVWLDVASQPARGQEQAEHMWRRVIMPNILRRSKP
jgi:hypothetical protein